MFPVDHTPAFLVIPGLSVTPTLWSLTTIHQSSRLSSNRLQPENHHCSPRPRDVHLSMFPIIFKSSITWTSSTWARRPFTRHFDYPWISHNLVNTTTIHHSSHIIFQLSANRIVIPGHPTSIPSSRLSSNRHFVPKSFQKVNSDLNLEFKTI